jgi:hypothetical protein
MQIEVSNMPAATIELTKAEIIQRGNEIYENSLRTKIEAGNLGKVIAIDVLSGEFELASNAIMCSKQLRARLPEAIIFVLRVGYPTLHRIL